MRTLYPASCSSTVQLRTRGCFIPFTYRDSIIKKSITSTNGTGSHEAGRTLSVEAEGAEVGPERGQTAPVAPKAVMSKG